jgi:hypothetical protein
MKKYGIDQVVQALQVYITQNDCKGFTRDNNARQTISEVTPFEVMADVARTTLKYDEIVDKKGWARQMPNEQKVMQAVYEYQHGNKISVDLNTVELDDLMKRMIRTNLDDTLNLLVKNPEIFNSYLASYIATIGNMRKDLNGIPNDNKSV